MSRSAPIDEIRIQARGARSAVRILAAATACGVAAGALLWWQHGGAVFTTLVSGALAWCM